MSLGARIWVFGVLLIEISSRKAVPEVLNLLPALDINHKNRLLYVPRRPCRKLCAPRGV